jgi:hypothetical protein
MMIDASLAKADREEVETALVRRYEPREAPFDGRALGT